MNAQELVAILTEDLTETAVMTPFKEEVGQPWGKVVSRVTGGKPWKDWLATVSSAKAEHAAQEIYEVAHALAAEGERIFKRKLLLATGGNPRLKIKVAVKSEESFLNKAVLRKKDPAKITDVLRAMIVYPSTLKEEGLKKLVTRLKSIFDLKEYEHKEKGTDPTFGYFGSHHLLAVVGGQAAELQLVSAKLAATRKIGHEIYTKLRGKEDEPDAEKLKQDSKRLYAGAAVEKPVDDAHFDEPDDDEGELDFSPRARDLIDADDDEDEMAA